MSWSSSSETRGLDPVLKKVKHSGRASPLHCCRGRLILHRSRREQACSEDKTPWRQGRPHVYACRVKKRTSARIRTRLPESPATKLRLLRKCLVELRAIYAEALRILNKLLSTSAAEIVHTLCQRFYIIQEYFVMRYHEARAHAISALGHVEAALYLG
jgi:hypothetical protein